jgi:hypothetical protein
LVILASKLLARAAGELGDGLGQVAQGRTGRPKGRLHAISWRGGGAPARSMQAKPCVSRGQEARDLRKQTASSKHIYFGANDHAAGKYPRLLYPVICHPDPLLMQIDY